MDWSKAKVIKKSNSIISSIRTEEEVVRKPISKAKGVNKKEDETIVLYPKVYQGCDECGTETIHFIKMGNVTCRSCGCSYNIIQMKSQPIVKVPIVVDYNKFLFL